MSSNLLQHEGVAHTLSPVTEHGSASQASPSCKALGGLCKFCKLAPYIPKGIITIGLTLILKTSLFSHYQDIRDIITRPIAILCIPVVLITVPILYRLYRNDINKDNMLELKSPIKTGCGLLFKLLKSHLNLGKKNILDANPELTNKILKLIFGVAKYNSNTQEGKPTYTLNQTGNDKTDNILRKIYCGDVMDPWDKFYIKTHCTFVTKKTFDKLSTKQYEHIKQLDSNKPIVVVSKENFDRLDKVYKTVRIAEHNGVSALHFRKGYKLCTEKEEENTYRKIADTIKTNKPEIPLSIDQIIQILKDPNVELPIEASQHRSISYCRARARAPQQIYKDIVLKEFQAHKYKVIDEGNYFPKDVVSFVFPGVGGDSSSSMPTSYEQNNCDIYLVDYKGIGQSRESEFEPLKDLFQSCTDFVANEVTKYNSEKQRVDLSGLSLGGATALHVHQKLIQDRNKKNWDIYSEATAPPVKISNAVDHVKTSIAIQLPSCLQWLFNIAVESYFNTVKKQIESSDELDKWNIDCADIFTQINNSNGPRGTIVNHPPHLDPFHSAFGTEWSKRGCSYYDANPY